MKFILILILLPTVSTAWGQTRCQQVGDFTYCDNGYTIQELGGSSTTPQQIIRQRETIQPDPVRPITIDPYSAQYYRSPSQLRPQYAPVLDPYRY